MATKRQKIEVGIFLATSAAALTVVLLYFAGVRAQALDPYYVEFDENIAGLTEGSQVTYNGVPVGKIIDLVVTPGNLVGITLGINPAKVTLRKGVKARYSIQSLFGPYVIDLSGGEPTASRLPPGSKILVKASLLTGLEETVAETVPVTLQRLGNLMEHIDGILSKINPDDITNFVRRVEEILTGVSKAVGDFRTRLNELADTLDKAIQSASAEIQQNSEKTAAAVDKIQKATESVSGKIGGAVDSLQAILDENRKPLAASLKRLDEALAKANEQLAQLELPAASKAIRKAADGVGAAADSVASAADSVGAAATSIGSGRTDLSRSIANIERDLSRSLEQLDRTLRAARELIEYLEQHPSAVLRGKPEQK